MTNSAISIYVINLDHRTDRWDQFQTAWKGILDFNHVTRISAIQGTSIPGFMNRPWFTKRTKGKEKTWAGVAGCIMSHKKVLKIALEKENELIAIFEDDALPHPSLDKNSLRHFFEICGSTSNLEWDVCYCGYSKIRSNFHSSPSSNTFVTNSIAGALSTHAYLMKREAILSIFPHFPEEHNVWSWIGRFRAIDTWYYRHLQSVLRGSIQACFPPIAIQSNSFSDIAQKETHYFSNAYPQLVANQISSSSPGQTTIQNLFISSVEWFKFFRSRLLGLPGSRIRFTEHPATNTTRHFQP